MAFDMEGMRKRLEAGGYRCVSQVIEHGEFAVRGALVDLFPMGSELPYRIDLFDAQVETIRTFDPETQRTLEKIEAIHLLPAREFPSRKRNHAVPSGLPSAFRGDPNRSPIYRDISRGWHRPASSTTCHCSSRHRHAVRLPAAASLVIAQDGSGEAAKHFWTQASERYEQLRHDVERPLLAPEQLFLTPKEITKGSAAFPACV